MLAFHQYFELKKEKSTLTERHQILNVSEQSLYDRLLIL